MKPLVYTKAPVQRTDITAGEIVDRVKSVTPEFQPCAYLNGTEDPRAFKWLLTLRVGDRDRILGCAEPRFIEFLQTLIDVDDSSGDPAIRQREGVDMSRTWRSHLVKLISWAFLGDTGPGASPQQAVPVMDTGERRAS